MGLPVRSLVLWCPDWPVTGWLRDRGEDPDAPTAVAVVTGNTVVACSRTARAEGVRVGMRRRDAQARCPSLTMVRADEGRDHRAFAPVLARTEQLAPGVQVIRPGLCALRARGPARYYGGEAEAARVVMGAVAALGIAGVRAGVADGVFTAELAARVGTSGTDPVCVVPPGRAAHFLAPLPVAMIGDDGIAGLLARLGVQTLGELAAMDPDRVRERFGQTGVRLHALAAGLDPRGVTPRTPPAELHQEVAFDPPLELADQIAFAVRQTADAFVTGLGRAGLVCTELRIELTGDRGERNERVWLHPTRFEAADVIDRVRWQLAEDARPGDDTTDDGGELGSGVVRVRIEPAVVDDAAHHAPVLFGTGAEERVHHALSRVQAMLGHRGVLMAMAGGGRWLSERQVLVPWGDRVGLDRGRARPWPGSLPSPLPGTVFPEPLPVQVAAADGEAVAVDERGMLTAALATLTVPDRRRRRVEAWAGPWPVSERGWDHTRRRSAYRFQVVDAESTAWLLICENGAWAAEGRYD